jgi:hypothetical protein
LLPQEAGKRTGWDDDEAEPGERCLKPEVAMRCGRPAGRPVARNRGRQAADLGRDLVGYAVVGVDDPRTEGARERSG